MIATIQDINLKFKKKGLKLSNHKDDFSNETTLRITDVQAFCQLCDKLGDKFKQWLNDSFIHRGALTPKTTNGIGLYWLIIQKNDTEYCKQLSISEYRKHYKNVSAEAIRKAIKKNKLSLLPNVIAAEIIGRNYIITVSQ